MEQNKEQSKKYEELNCYERAMANATLEQRLEAMAREVQQMALALNMSIHVDSVYYGEGKSGADVSILPLGTREIVSRSAEFVGDLFGIIEEANRLKAAKEEDND